MWHTVLLGLVGGVLAGNAIPHFVRGITKRPYPNVWGNGPVPNLIGGWAGLVAAGALSWWADLDRYPLPGIACAAVGVLLIGLFHAGPGAFGRRDT